MLQRLLAIWAFTVYLIAVAAGMAYTAARQTLRLLANETQIQLAEDVAGALNTGMAPEMLVDPYRMDPSVSLKVFVVIYDRNKRVLASSGVLEGKDPVPPAGVFDYVDTHGENRVTWMPRQGVRIAIVMTRYKQGYVLAGRSLRDTDRNTMEIGDLLVMFALLCSAVASMVYLGIWLEYRRRARFRGGGPKDGIDLQRTRI